MVTVLGSKRYLVCSFLVFIVKTARLEFSLIAIALPGSRGIFDAQEVSKRLLKLRRQIFLSIVPICDFEAEGVIASPTRFIGEAEIISDEIIQSSKQRIPR